MHTCPSCFQRVQEPPTYEHVARIARAVLETSQKLEGFTFQDYWDVSGAPFSWECRVYLEPLGRIEISLDAERLYVELGVGPGYRTLLSREPSYGYDTTIYLDDYSTPGTYDVVKAAMHMLYGLTNYHQKASLNARLRDQKGKFIS